MTHIKRNLSRSASAGIVALGFADHGCGTACTVQLPSAMPLARCRYGRWPLVAAPLPLVAGFSLLPSVPLLAAGALLLVPPEPKGFFQPPHELHADSESTIRPARNTFRCVRFMINSSVVGVLQCVRDDAVPLQ
jgi:hypothetical protein